MGAPVGVEGVRRHAGVAVEALPLLADAAACVHVMFEVCLMSSPFDSWLAAVLCGHTHILTLDGFWLCTVFKASVSNLTCHVKDHMPDVSLLEQPVWVVVGACWPVAVSLEATSVCCCTCASLRFTKSFLPETCTSLFLQQEQSAATGTSLGHANPLSGQAQSLHT